LSIYSYNGEKVAGRRLIEQLEGYAYAAVDLYEQASGGPIGPAEITELICGRVAAYQMLLGPRPRRKGQRRQLSIVVTSQDRIVDGGGSTGPVADTSRSLSGEVIVSADEPLFPSPTFAKVCEVATLLAAAETLLRSTGHSLVDVMLTVDGQTIDMIETLNFE
jgi:hypothetical protein